MKNKYIVPILCLIGLTSFVVLGSSPGLVGKILESAQDNPITRIFSQSTAQAEPRKSDIESSEKAQRPEPFQKKMAEQKNEIPEYVLYEQVFRLTIAFDELAKSQQAKGEPVTQLRSYFKDEAKLTAQEDDSLTQTANNYNQEIKVVDGQAEVVIRELQQQFDPSSEEQLIQPSPELLELQGKRNKLALLYRDKLKDLLGADGFNKFDSFVKEDFAATFKVMPIPTKQDTDNQGGVK